MILSKKSFFFHLLRRVYTSTNQKILKIETKRQKKKNYLSNSHDTIHYSHFQGTISLSQITVKPFQIKRYHAHN